MRHTKTGSGAIGAQNPECRIMGRPRNPYPKLYSDQNGNAFTKVEGRFFRLGKAGTDEATRRYNEVLANWAKGEIRERAEPPKVSEKPVPEKPPLSINELLVLFLPSLDRLSRSERLCYLAAMRVLRETFGHTLAEDFGGVRFEAMRESMIAGDEATKRKPWARTTVNRQAKRVRSIFRWAAAKEHISPQRAASLNFVASIAPGETTAPETEPRKPVDLASVMACCTELRANQADFLRLLVLTGARPGELLKVTTGILDRSGPEWICSLARHKTWRHNKPRVLVFNRTAVTILQKYLRGDPNQPLFGFRRDCFTVAVRRACVRAKIPTFVPYQCRHFAATRIVDELGLEAAQALLGHSSAAMTRHYAQTALENAKRGARVLG
jgi:integrase